MTTVPIIAQGSAESLGRILPVWSVLPFAVLLASIAILPLFAHAWWETACGQAGISVEGPRYLASSSSSPRRAHPSSRRSHAAR